MLATVYDGDGEDRLPAFKMLDKHHDRHRENTVDLTGNAGELATGVVAAGQFYGEEDIGAKEPRIDSRVLEQAGVVGQFLISKLKEEIGGYPISKKSFRFGEATTARVRTH